MVELLWPILSGADSGLATAGLGIALIILLVGGIFLLFRGVRDLIWELLHAR
jgi:hypothetical protein